MEKNATIRHVAIVERCSLTLVGLWHLFRQAEYSRYDVHFFQNVRVLEVALAQAPFEAVIYSLSGERDLRQECLLCLNKVSHAYPSIKRVVLTNDVREASLIQHLSPSRLHGILNKADSVPSLSQQLMALLNETDNGGQNPLSQWMMNSNGTLSPTELAILRYMTYGYSMTDIAGHLERNIKTIRAHKFNAMTKLGVSSDIGLLTAADILMHLGAGSERPGPGGISSY